MGSTCFRCRLYRFDQQFCDTRKYIDQYVDLGGLGDQPVHIRRICQVGMLVAQAAGTFKHITGVAPELARMCRHLAELVAPAAGVSGRGG